MNSSGLLLLALAVAAVNARAADATSRIDYTQRNGAFAPAGTVTPSRRTPELAENLQEKRVTPATVDKTPAAVGDRRAPIDVVEAREKQVREKTSHAPETRERPVSAFDHRRAAISTATDAQKPATVARYQDGLTAASAANMARFPALDGATKVTLNRFVFRKNGADPAAPAAGAPVTPAAGGSALRP